MRGENRSPKLDGIYRAEQRGESWRTRTQVEEVGRELLRGNVNAERGKETLIETRKEVERGWWGVSEILAAQGQRDLAAEVERFVSRMPPPRSDRELIALELRKRVRDARAREGPIR